MHDRRAGTGLGAADLPAHARGRRDHRKPVRAWRTGARQTLALGRALRASGYDRAYVLPNSFKSALVPIFARIPERIGFVGEARQLLLTDARPTRRTGAAPHGRALRIVWPCARGTSLQRPVPRPQLQVDPAERDALLSRLQSDLRQPHRMFLPGRRVRARQALAAVTILRRLPRKLAAERLRGVAHRLGEGTRHRRGNSRGRRRRRCESLRPHQLDEAVVLLSCADLVVSNDSGPDACRGGARSPDDRAVRLQFTRLHAAAFRAARSRQASSCPAAPASSASVRSDTSTV